MTERYHIIMGEHAIQDAHRYLNKIRNGKKPGGLLGLRVENADPQCLDIETLLDALFLTKRPRVFAESEIRGDGSDWNQEELSILGDMSVAMRVLVFDDGRHAAPAIHSPPFHGHLVFTPGALLRNDLGMPPADLNRVTTDGELNPKKFNLLYEKRLLPIFLHINETAARNGRNAVITIPGLGCGQFAGRFKGRIGAFLANAITQILKTHGEWFDRVALVYFDPYSECENKTFSINGVDLRVRPLTKGNDARPQLCHPTAYEEPGDDYSACDLYSLVAWDHVSWPGNDFYAGDRATDDGVKAAATSSMSVITGIEGTYDSGCTQYRPPDGFSHWQEVIDQYCLTLTIGDTLRIYP